MRQQKDWCRDYYPRIIQDAQHASRVLFYVQI